WVCWCSGWAKAALPTCTIKWSRVLVTGKEFCSVPAKRLRLWRIAHSKSRRSLSAERRLPKPKPKRSNPHQQRKRRWYSTIGAKRGSGKWSRPAGSCGEKGREGFEKGAAQGSDLP